MPRVVACVFCSENFRWLVSCLIRTLPELGEDRFDVDRGDSRYIVDLVEKVIRVSMDTLDIMEHLPALEELPHPDNWPAEWN